MKGWALPATLAMLLNGIVLVLLASIDVQLTNQYLALVFISSGGISCAMIAGRRARPRLADLAIGTVAGLTSYVGNVFQLRCLSHASASVVFPVAFGGSMTLVTIASVFLFRERLSLRGWCAILVGVASVIVLKLS